MKVLIVNRGAIPVFGYGGTERVIWDLGRALVRAGHQVGYLVPPGSHCDFATVLPLRPGQDWRTQVPAGTDIVHLQFQPQQPVDVPHLVTEHGNSAPGVPLAVNTVFVSRDHAARHGSDAFVHNGLDWSAYGPVDFTRPRHRFHFLGKAAWRVKNVQGAIDVARQARVPLDVLGGSRFNWKRGIRLTFSPRIRFHGMVGGATKFALLGASAGLVFPVRWHEPFGLAVIESLYFGGAVFATPYGALPELLPPGCGLLSAQREVLAEAVRAAAGRPGSRAAHDHVVTCFSADAMAAGYLRYYQQVLDGEPLHAAPPAMRQPARHLPWD